MKNENSVTTPDAPLRIQTGVRAGTMRQFFGRVWAAIDSGPLAPSTGPNAVGGVRG